MCDVPGWRGSSTPPGHRASSASDSVLVAAVQISHLHKLLLANFIHHVLEREETRHHINMSPTKVSATAPFLFRVIAAAKQVRAAITYKEINPEDWLNHNDNPWSSENCDRAIWTFHTKH